jgi:hypothetical protein
MEWNGHNDQQRTMRTLRKAVLAALMLAAVAGSWAPKAALADERARVEGTFSVSFMYPSAVNYCATAGANVGVEGQGLGKMSGLGPMFLMVKKCFTFADGTYAGMFKMTADNGDIIVGTYAGIQRANDENGFGPFDGTLTVTGGTGRFWHARGALKFRAVASPTSAGVTASTVNGMAFYLVSGSISLQGH